MKKTLVIVFLLIAGIGLVVPAEELRGIWLDKKQLYLPKAELSKLLDRLQDANFNAIFPCCYYKSMVTYPGSKYLPQDPEFKGEDRLAWLIEESQKRDLKVYGWLEYGFYAYHTPDAKKDKSRGTLLDKEPELTAVAGDGMQYIHHPQWGDFFSLCPDNPRAHKLLIKIFEEIAGHYQFDGINLDRIRYPRDNFCFCEHSKQAFRQQFKRELVQFPADSADYTIWQRWRATWTERFVSALQHLFSLKYPTLEITAAVVPREEMEGKGQQWHHWLNKGLLDAVIPMLYRANISGDLEFISDNIKPHLQSHFYAGLDTNGNPPELVAQQIEQVRKWGGKGVVLWYAGSIEDDLPILKKGVFAQPAEPPKLKAPGPHLGLSRQPRQPPLTTGTLN